MLVGVARVVGDFDVRKPLAAKPSLDLPGFADGYAEIAGGVSRVTA
jgi:hypothetical protein